eukprot:11993422-Ditylum_brightwellii.AAC.1
MNVLSSIWLHPPIYAYPTSANSYTAVTPNKCPVIVDMGASCGITLFASNFIGLLQPPSHSYTVSMVKL